MLEQAGARLGRRDRPAGEERRAEVGLQRGDVLGHGRLRVAELARRLGERPQPDDGGERAQEAGIHRDQYSLSTDAQRSLDMNSARGQHAGHAHRHDRARRQPLAERPRPHPRPGDRRGAPPPRRHRRRPVLDPVRGRRGPERPRGLRRHLGRARQPVPERRGRDRRRPVRARARRPVPRHLRRLPARRPDARPRPVRHRGRGARGVRPRGRARHRRARVLARRPRGRDPLRARLADRADHGRRAQRRALPLRLRPRPPRTSSASRPAGSASARATTRATSASSSSPTTRSSSARCSSRSSRATAPARTR